MLALLDLPQVLDWHYVAGHCDYAVRFKLASMEQYDALCDQHFTANPAVKRVDSLVVMKTVKGPRELLISLAGQVTEPNPDERANLAR